MPQSKKRNRDRMRKIRDVQPEMVEVIEEWTPHKHTIKVNGREFVQPNRLGMNPVVEVLVQPIPNCPDGRYREG